MFKSHFEKMLFFFKLYGLFGSLVFAWNLLCCGREKIYIWSDSGSETLKSLKNPDLHVGLVMTISDFQKISAAYADIVGIVSAQQDSKRIAAGREFLAVVFWGSQIVGWGWVKKGPVVYGRFELTEDDCVIHQCRTVRNFRRRRVYLTLLGELTLNLKKMGINHIYIGAKSFNKASLRAIEKARFIFRGEFNGGNFFLRIWSHIRYNTSKVCRNS